MKTQKATKVWGQYSYQVALAEDGKFYSRVYINGKQLPWEKMPEDLADPTRNMMPNPGPFKYRIPMA